VYEWLGTAGYQEFHADGADADGELTIKEYIPVVSTQVFLVYYGIIYLRLSALLVLLEFRMSLVLSVDAISSILVDNILSFD
jgi:hypothetical protein